MDKGSEESLSGKWEVGEKAGSLIFFLKSNRIISVQFRSVTDALAGHFYTTSNVRSETLNQSMYFSHININDHFLKSMWGPPWSSGSVQDSRVEGQAIGTALWQVS